MLLRITIRSVTMFLRITIKRVNLLMRISFESLLLRLGVLDGHGGLALSAHPFCSYGSVL
jgi:hypothetical protein